MADGNTLEAGQFALSGAAQQLTGAGAPTKGSVNGVQLRNMSGTNKFYVGSDSSVSATTGFPVEPNAVLGIDILNPRKIWVIGTAADKIAWLTLAP